ncbi:MAG: hypothetical protein ABSH35_18705 [Isosphaeraceae bacterium]|jgi:hypothetical protein
MFARIFGRPTAFHTSRRIKRNPAVETLEGRQLMSLGPEFLVSVPTPAAQVQSANASSTNGSSVVVWTDFSHGDAQISGQLFNSQGGKVGPVMDLASAAGLYEEQPSVAMDAHGDFVVSWTQFFPNGHSNVLAQKFNAAGATVGGVVPVAVGTFAQTNSSVAMDAKGDFVVSYTRDTNNNNPDIFAKLYNTNDQLLNVVTVAGTFLDEDLSSVAMTPDGRFDVAYQVQVSNTYVEVMASRYTASGGLLEQATIANNAPLSESPKVAMDNQGNAVIAYQKWVGNNWDVEARRLSGTGLLGGEINVQSTTANETSPSVALEGNAGAFVVAYDSGIGVNVSEVNSSNVVIDTYSAGQSRFAPAISINAQNEFLVTYTADIAPDMFIAGRRGLL